MPVGFEVFNRRKEVIRMPVNPLDKSTIVSIYPKEINEVKPTLFPGRFIIPAAKDDDSPELLVIGASSWFKDSEENQPAIEIPNSSIMVAESIIKDFNNGLLGYAPDCGPGIFFVPGEVKQEEVKKKCFPELIIAKAKQKKYWAKLVELADVDWSRTNGNPLAISDIARIGAQKLGLDKPWMQDFSNIKLDKCPACGQLVDKQFPVCRFCKAIINEARAKELNLKFAVG